MRQTTARSIDCGKYCVPFCLFPEIQRDFDCHSRFDWYLGDELSKPVHKVVATNDGLATIDLK